MSAQVRRIPEGMHTLTPHLICQDASAAIDFYQRAFGAIEISRIAGPDGKLMHAMLRIGDSALMLMDENPQCGALSPTLLKGTAVSIHVYVEDVDAAFERAVQAGHRQDAAGRHVLGRPLRRGHRSIRAQLVDCDARQRCERRGSPGCGQRHGRMPGCCRGKLTSIDMDGSNHGDSSLVTRASMHTGESLAGLFVNKRRHRRHRDQGPSPTRRMKFLSPAGYLADAA